MPQASSKPEYSIWYCPKYPVSAIQFSTKTSFLREAETRPKLLEDIRQRGLINPLLVLNHRDPKHWKDHYVMTGNNRLWAVRTLGWESVRAVVTGFPDQHCEYFDVQWEEIGDFFPDGEVYLGAQGPRLRGYSDFTKGEFP